MIKNEKRNKGSLLLEVLLMVGVLALILPIMQNQPKKQLELSENILNAKDKMK